MIKVEQEDAYLSAHREPNVLGWWDQLGHSTEEGLHTCDQ